MKLIGRIQVSRGVHGQRSCFVRNHSPVDTLRIRRLECVRACALYDVDKCPWIEDDLPPQLHVNLTMYEERWEYTMVKLARTGAAWVQLLMFQ